MRSRVYETVERPSVRPSVCLSHRSTAVAACGVIAAERPAGRTYRRHSAANAGSVSLTADGRGWTCTRSISLSWSRLCISLLFNVTREC